MKTSKYKAHEIREIEEANARNARKGGFALMPVRDQGRAKLENGLTVHWHTNNPPTNVFEHDGSVIEVSQSTIPEGKFGLEFKDEMVVMDAEELQRWLRWA